MWNKKYAVGQFVAMNQGEILECHGKLVEHDMGKKSAKRKFPFCVQNYGIIENAACELPNDQCQPAVLNTEWVMENVMEIHSAIQLQEIAKQVNTGDPFYCKGCYRLMRDLDLKHKKWIPFGNSKQTPFSGIFDGNGHAVQNLSVPVRNNECAGFFGYLKNAKVRNLSIEGKVKGGKYTGAMAGICEDSLVVSCFSSADVKGEYCTGGFIGKNKGQIAHCFFAGSVRHKNNMPVVLSTGMAQSALLAVTLDSNAGKI